MPVDFTKVFYVPLEVENQHLAIDGEILIDYEKAIVYLRAENKTIQLGAYEIDKAIQEKIDEFLDNASLNGNSLYKLENRLNRLIDWKERQMSSDMDLVVNTFLELIEKFKGFNPNGETLKAIIDNKVDAVEGYKLSSNNFTVEEYNKLMSIDSEANLYTHPKSKTCKYFDPVESVNGKTGDINITKDDVGLENLEIDANNYTHPQFKVCNTKIVTSLNNKTGEITITKDDVGMSNLLNIGMKDLSDIEYDENSYFNAKNLNILINAHAHKMINKVRLVDTQVNLEITPKDIINDLYTLFYIYKNPQGEFIDRPIYQTGNSKEIMYVNPATFDSNIIWTEFMIGKQKCYISNNTLLDRMIPRVINNKIFALNYIVINDIYYMITVPDKRIIDLFDISKDQFNNKDGYILIMQDLFNENIFYDNTVMGMDINGNFKQGSFSRKVDTISLYWRPMLKQMTWK